MPGQGLLVKVIVHGLGVAILHHFLQPELLVQVLLLQNFVLQIGDLELQILLLLHLQVDVLLLLHRLDRVRFLQASSKALVVQLGHLQLLPKGHELGRRLELGNLFFEKSSSLIDLHQLVARAHHLPIGLRQPLRNIEPMGRKRIRVQETLGLPLQLLFGKSVLDASHQRRDAVFHLLVHVYEGLRLLLLRFIRLPVDSFLLLLALYDLQIYSIQVGSMSCKPQ